ncbi:MAG: Txe/YoeB family addiction module toxin [Selenomonadaceae bacterium]|nr:Txe/YoeB family addiction module toxin [Selenomonadaceae bacterium]
MDKTFHDRGFEDYLYWQTQDKKILKRINDLIKDIERNGADKDIGKPEYLKYKDCWSRRITDEHRLTYSVKDDKIYIFSCKGHYE